MNDAAHERGGSSNPSLNIAIKIAITTASPEYMENLADSRVARGKATDREAVLEKREGYNRFYETAIQKAAARLGYDVEITRIHDPKEISNYISTFDAFIGTGGEDISQKLYTNDESLLHLSPDPVNIYRDALEGDLIKKCWDNDIPILQVCRSAQSNKNLLRDLYKDPASPLYGKKHANPIDPKKSSFRKIAAKFPFSGHLFHCFKYFKKDTRISHSQPSKENNPSYPFAPNHIVNIVPGSSLQKILGLDLGETRIPTNALHHQAINPKTLSKDFVVCAYTDDGIVEAVEFSKQGKFAKNHFPCIAVQWHPEQIASIDIPRSETSPSLQGYLAAANLFDNFLKYAHENALHRDNKKQRDQTNLAISR